MLCVCVYLHWPQSPSPGVRHFVSMLPHSEASLEHSLLPLPPYPPPKHKYLLDPQVKRTQFFDCVTDYVITTAIIIIVIKDNFYYKIGTDAVTLIKGSAV